MVINTDCNLSDNLKVSNIIMTIPRIHQHPLTSFLNKFQELFSRFRRDRRADTIVLIQLCVQEFGPDPVKEEIGEMVLGLDETSENIPDSIDFNLLSRIFVISPAIILYDK